MKRTGDYYILSLLLLTASFCTDSNDKNIIDLSSELSSKERLGKFIFNDRNLSTPPGQACSDCHSEKAGFADPLKELPVSRGVYEDRYGSRNDLTVAYASYTPEFHYDSSEGLYVGGFFWDGRAKTLADQAKGPPMNPLEMANPNIESVVNEINKSAYRDLFIEVYGANALDDPVKAYDYFADALAAYQGSGEINKFTSKYDYYLRGETGLTEEELMGLEIFERPDKGNCAACHPSRTSSDGTPPLFTDHTYDNLGVPKNPESPFYYLRKEFNPQGLDFVDYGLGNVVGKKEEKGKFKVPTLRNLALTDPYMHNGVFKTIRQVVSFYNTRDIGNWPEPEVKENVNYEELGDLGLTEKEIDYLVAFMRTLTDGYIPEK